MTRVDFYLLPSTGDDAVAGLAARLCDKAVSAGMRCFVQVPSEALAQKVDDVLWTQRQGSFLSHERHRGQAASVPPPYILLGDGSAPPKEWGDVLVNLGPDIPPFFSQFARCLELVGSSDAERQQSRDRFKFYRDRGYALTTFEQTAEGGWKTR